MENTPLLYDTLVQVLSQHRKWLDVRHLKTLAWMMVGLIETGLIGLTYWAPLVHGRAVYAQSSVRRFARWLDNERIDVHKLYGPLIQQALGGWGQPYAVSGVGYFAALGAILRHTHLNHLSGPGDSAGLASHRPCQQQRGV